MEADSGIINHKSNENISVYLKNHHIWSALIRWKLLVCLHKAAKIGLFDVCFFIRAC
jgi:hypothetical protein